MDIRNTPLPLLTEGQRLADHALLAALLKHACENHIEVAQQIITAAKIRLPAGSAFEGEQSAGDVARALLDDELQRIQQELTPPSQLGKGGFQTQVGP